MCESILFFADHDLPMNTADAFIKEFARRTKCNIILTDVSQNIPDITRIHFSDDIKNTWYFTYWRTDGDFDKVFSNVYRDIGMFFCNGEIEISFELFGKTVEVKRINVRGKDELRNNYRWCTVRDFLLQNTEQGHRWLEYLLETCRQYLHPLLHSKQILLLKDSDSLVHEHLYGEYLAERGMSIKEALALTASTVIRNNDCFKYSNIYNFSNVFADPIFLFDLSKKDSYMINELEWKKIQFLEHNPDELQEGYVFTIDGKNLEFNSFQPLGNYDINFEALTIESVDLDSCPPIACCTCGCIDCDSVRAFVEFAGDTVLWTAFHINRCDSKETVMKNNLGKYTFSKEQYFQAINSLRDGIKKHL